jgi:hypothetical protein
MLPAGFLFGLFFHPEDGGEMSLGNIGLLSTDYKALHPGRHKSKKRIYINASGIYSYHCALKG